MKIAIDVTPVLPGGETGGALQVLMELLRGFCATAENDEFILLTSYINDSLFREFEQYGMQRWCIRKEPAALVRKFAPIAALLNRMLGNTIFRPHQSVLRRAGVAVLFCPMTDPVYNEQGIPTVSIVHDLQHFYYPHFFAREEVAHRINFYSMVKKKVDFFICVSSFTRDTVINRLGISADKTFTIHNCVHARLNRATPRLFTATLEKYSLQDKTYCIFPANFWPHKNHAMLFTAMNIFNRRFPQYAMHLVLTGSSLQNESCLMKACRQMGLADRVHFLGYLNEEELAAVWQGAHFLIFPSLFEGFGIPLVEAMMYGKPILASNVTSIPEVAGEAALYFDPRKPDEMVEALRRIMSDEGLYRRLTEEGRKQLEQYRYEDMVKQYLAVLHRAGEGGSVAEYAEVTGIYNDCWAGEQIEIGLGAGKGKRVFTLRGYIPEWHPAQEVKLKVMLPDGRKKLYVAHRDEELTVREQLSEQAGIMKIAVSGGFRPDNGDERTLTFLVDEASVVNAYGGMKLYEFIGRRM
jgi:glycosyltransferase involved in cell wall biosynthesis